MIYDTHTKDITGETIRLGDTVGYDLEGENSTFEVVFQDNAFRKRYKKWEFSDPLPMLETGKQAEEMRLKIVARPRYMDIDDCPCPCE